MEVLTEPLFIFYQKSCVPWEVPGDWWLANLMSIYRRGQEDMGSYRPLSLQKITLSAIIWQLGDEAQPAGVCEKLILLFDQPDLRL